MVRKIKLTQGYYAEVSNKDYHWLNSNKWYASVKKLKTRELVYACRTIERKGKKKTVLMHREVIKKQLEDVEDFELLEQFIENPKAYPVDHINGDGLKNTRENLKIVTPRQNHQNRHNITSSRYPGVSWDKSSKRWKAHIRIDGVLRYLGSDKSEVKAFGLYKAALNKIK